MVAQRGWQLLRAKALVAGHRRVTAEFSDVGHSRVLPWPRRPEAARQIDAPADPDRAFGAVVLGSGERAFYGSRFAAMAPLFGHHGVRLWLPELGGPGGRPRPATRYRSGSRWTPTAVRGILAHPRYTGRRGWNRRRTDHELLDPATTALGHHDIARWNPPRDWIVSRHQAHPVLERER